MTDNKFSINVDGLEVQFDMLCEKDQNFLIRHDVKCRRVYRQDSFDYPKTRDVLEVFLELNEYGTRMDESHLEMIREDFQNRKDTRE